jgi:hypothetical protein
VGNLLWMSVLRFPLQFNRWTCTGGCRSSSELQRSAAHTCVTQLRVLLLLNLLWVLCFVACVSRHLSSHLTVIAITSLRGSLVIAHAQVIHKQPRARALARKPCGHKTRSRRLKHGRTRTARRRQQSASESEDAWQQEAQRRRLASQH